MPPSPVDTARELAAEIRSCAATIETDRELPAPLFESLVDAGLFHLLLPRSLGCPELDLPTFVRVIGELGLGDASTAWIVSQCSVFATYAARMPRDVARAIWIDPPRSIVANTPLPTATAQGGPRRIPRDGPTGVQHRVPARHVAGGAGPHHRERNAPRLLEQW